MVQRVYLVWAVESPLWFHFWCWTGGEFRLWWMAVGVLEYGVGACELEMEGKVSTIRRGHRGRTPIPFISFLSNLTPIPQTSIFKNRNITDPKSKWNQTANKTTLWISEPTVPSISYKQARWPLRNNTLYPSYEDEDEDGNVAFGFLGWGGVGVCFLFGGLWRFQIISIAMFWEWRVDREVWVVFCSVAVLRCALKESLVA